MDVVWALLLYLLGLCLCFVELFIPSGGIIGIAAALCLAYAIWEMFAQNAWVASLAIAFTLIYVVVLVRWGFRRFRHDSSLAEGVATGEDVKKAESLVGCTGAAVTPLRPAGVARIEGRRFDVVTQGGFVEKGGAVEVIKAEGNRVLVRGR